MGDTWYLDEVLVTIQGQRQYPWRAVNQDGDVIDLLVQSRRNRGAATRFFRKRPTNTVPSRRGRWLWFGSTYRGKFRLLSAAHPVAIRLNPLPPDGWW